MCGLECIHHGTISGIRRAYLEGARAVALNQKQSSTAVELAKHVRNFRAELHRTAGDDLIEKRHRGFSSQIL
jgi:broad specificity polyphosphatase/5'/3'-nucleotidase SurE